MSEKPLPVGGRLGFAGIESRILRLPLSKPQPNGSVGDLVAVAAEAGFNGVAVPVYASGRICWPNESHGRRPRPWPEAALGLGDLLPLVCAAASQAGLLVYGCASLLNLDESLGAVPRLLRRWQVETERSPGFSDGPYYLCSNRPEVRRFLGDVMSAMVSAYPVDGVILDTFAVPGQFCAPAQALCRCAACSSAVDRSLLFDLRKLTSDPDDDRYRRWSEWQVQRLGDFLSGLIGRMIAGRRGLRILLEVPPEAEAHPAMREWMEQRLVHGAISREASSDAASQHALLRFVCRETGWDEKEFHTAVNSPHPESDGIVIRCASWPDADALVLLQSAFGQPARPAEGDPLASVIEILDSAGLQGRRGPEAGTLRHIREVLDSTDARHPDLLADLASDCWHVASSARDDLAAVAGSAARLLQLAALL
ncbi:MAG: hypothetical protein N2111_00510 [Candidatus Sumerlaeaceae bacterium]|nr:hypothetical protein [Candidatus Sumerlaeaceae bacterium]